VKYDVNNFTFYFVKVSRKLQMKWNKIVALDVRL